jgi:hypothetical protein
MPPPQRWYDHSDELAQSIQFLLSCPQGLQTMLAERLSELIRQSRLSPVSAETLRTLTPEKVMGLFKAKKKLRDYDQNNRLHQAMNDLYVLPDDLQEEMGKQVLALFGHVRNYLDMCRLYQIPPQMSHLDMLTSAYVNQGEDAAQSFLMSHKMQCIREPLQEIQHELQRVWSVDPPPN